MAYFEASSCRHMGMGTGPVPYTAIRVVSEDFGYDMEWFLPVVRGLDAVFLKKVKEEQEKETRKSGKMGGKSKRSR